MALPRRQQMRALTLEALRSGIHWSDNIREYIARKAETPIDWRFTKAHAWALVDLQASGEVVKQGRREYALAQEAAEAAREPIPEPSEGHFPRWARTLVAHANRKNGPTGPRFTEADLIAVWKDCDGKCAVTRLEFSSELVGTSLVKKAYAPSLDRIRAGTPYTRENCRLVMVAVNFAMNAWGLDVYLTLARAAVESEPA
ncbi:MAG: hypothetical protein M3Y41_22145 [Pseudomonadota bacterium]|nr:hypothetical protein [Pseudomonadota bacterium]